MITLQPATYNDVSLIKKLANEIWYSYFSNIVSLQQIEYMLTLMYSEETIKNELKEGYQWRLILLKNRPVGFLSYHFEPDINRVKLYKLYVLLEHHGKGYGQQALEYVKKCSGKYKATYLYLTVNKKNEKAIKAYLKSGFYIEKDVVADIGNGYVMDDYIMAFKL